jgi:hypothetical protein
MGAKPFRARVIRQAAALAQEVIQFAAIGLFTSSTRLARMPYVELMISLNISWIGSPALLYSALKALIFL